MAEKKNVSFRPDTESAAVLDKIVNKSAFINNAIHSYESGRLPDMQKAAEVFCRIEKTAGQLVGGVDVSGLLELHTSRRGAADHLWNTSRHG